LILNYNGRALLRECLPSVLAAAAAAPMPCRVSVVDNGSTDGSLEELALHWPSVPVIAHANNGLASFNQVLTELNEPAIVLLNNDVKLHSNAIGPLIDALESNSDALFSAPQCWTFDGSSYEGMRTFVRMHFGMIQGLCRVPGHERTVDVAGLTASAGPVLAVDRQKFLALGGYDPMYFPGRIEDLDLGFAGWMRGWRGYYVPRSLAYHKGFGTFQQAFGKAGCDRLAARNTLLFAWKNLRGRWLLEHLTWLPVRVLWAITRGRFEFLRAFGDALKQLPTALRGRRAQADVSLIARQSAYFSQFRW
jgi:GT2 family glycosyltransferase